MRISHCFPRLSSAYLALVPRHIDPRLSHQTPPFQLFSFLAFPTTFPNGINPLETGESCKVTVHRIEHGSVLDRERRQVRIRHQIPGCRSFFDLSLKDLPMRFRRSHQSNTRLIKPAINPFHTLLNGQRPFMETLIGRDPQIGIQNRPAKIHRLCPTQAGIPPSARLVVVHRGSVLSVEKQIGIWKNQRKSSPSATASSSWILSYESPLRSPKSRPFVR